MSFDEKKLVYLRQFASYFAVQKIEVNIGEVATLTLLRVVLDSAQPVPPEPPTPVLPYDAEVEYLESTGTQWIDTGIALTMAWTEITSSWYLISNNRFAYMARANGTSYFWGVYAARADYGNSAAGQIAITISVNVWHNLVDTSTGFYLDGSKLVTRTEIAQRTSGNMLLFASNLNGTVTSGSFRCGGYKVTTGGVDIIDLIPVRVGQVGYMYDRVSGELFGNSGTGNFILGNDKN
jgi:hypothetical protein